MHRIFAICTLCLLLSGRAFSQTPTDSRLVRQNTGIHLSLWKGMSTHTTNSWLNLGLISSFNQLHGVGINILGGMVSHQANGLQIAGITQLVGEQMNGISIAGLAGIYHSRMNGICLAGLTNVTGMSCHGLAIGGFLNFITKQASGVQIAGIGNIIGEECKGLSISGLINVAGNQMKGMQLSGIMNIASQSNGVQLSPINVVAQGKGVQIGLINYYDEQFDGIQLGLVNANKHTQLQLMAFGGNCAKLNVAARLKNKYHYSIFGIGSHYLDFNDKFSGALFYRTGLEIPLFKHFFLSGDLGYQHVETFKNKHHHYPSRFYALQARLNLEWHTTDRLGCFLSGGYSHERLYHTSRKYDQRPIIEGGIILYHL